MRRRVEDTDRSQPMTEAELKSAIIKAARAQGWAVYTTPQIKMLRPARLGSSSGYPDLTMGRDGEAMWIECKDEGGEQTPAQRMWQEALPAYHVIRPSDLASGRVAELVA
jgi:hypothetical protein